MPNTKELTMLSTYSGKKEDRLSDLKAFLEARLSADDFAIAYHHVSHLCMEWQLGGMHLAKESMINKLERYRKEHTCKPH